MEGVLILTPSDVVVYQAGHFGHVTGPLVLLGVLPCGSHVTMSVHLNWAG